MHWKQRIGIAAAVVSSLLACPGPPSRAAIDHNEVAAFLVFPYVVAEDSGGSRIETFLTITNSAPYSVIAHVAFINGDESAGQYCFQCDFDVPLAGRSSEMLAFERTGASTTVHSLSSGAQFACSQRMGFVTVDVEDASGNVLTDNVLLGEQVIVDYSAGTSVSFPALPIQGDIGNGDRNFQFDGLEYQKLPASVTTGFIAPDFAGPLEGDLVLLTLAFRTRFPPLVDCAVSGVDATGSAFTAGVQLGCWRRIPLGSIDPELTYPHLGGAYGGQQNGRVQLRCTTFGTGSNGVSDGGVLGLILQTAAPGSVLRRDPLGPAVSSKIVWGRTLHQSVVVGDDVVLELDAAPFARKGSDRPRRPVLHTDAAKARHE